MSGRKSAIAVGSAVTTPFRYRGVVRVISGGLAYCVPPAGEERWVGGAWYSLSTLRLEPRVRAPREPRVRAPR